MQRVQAIDSRPIAQAQVAGIQLLIRYVVDLLSRPSTPSRLTNSDTIFARPSTCRPGDATDRMSWRLLDGSLPL